MSYVVLVALVVSLSLQDKRACLGHTPPLLHVTCYVKASPTLDFSHARQSSGKLIILPQRLLSRHAKQYFRDRRIGIVHFL